jgi:hypothetical protein
MKGDIMIIGEVVDRAGAKRKAVLRVQDVELVWCPLEPGVPLVGPLPAPVLEISFHARDGSMYRQATWPLDLKVFQETPIAGSRSKG